MTLITLIKLVALFLTTMIATIVDTVAGGGGLLVVPALLLYGLPPALALGTNKLQASFGSGSATWSFIQEGHIHLKEVWFGILWCFVGASIGTWLIMHIHPQHLRQIIPWIILVILIYLLVAKDAGHMTRQARIKQSTYFFIFGNLLGFYDGFFGPGTGSFWVVSLIILLGWNIKKATMQAKIYNFTSNLFSLIWFMWGGHINYKLGLLLSIAGILGAQVGSTLVIRKTTYFIRPCFIIMMLILCVVLFYKTYF